MEETMVMEPVCLEVHRVEDRIRFEFVSGTVIGLRQVAFEMRQEDAGELGLKLTKLSAER